jgi:hypothetical protein
MYPSITAAVAAEIVNDRHAHAAVARRAPRRPRALLRRRGALHAAAPRGRLDPRSAR